MKAISAVLPIMLVLAACSGPGGASKSAQAAAACEAYAKDQLGDKAYRLDAKVFAASMQDAGDGALSLRAPITIEPGLATESTVTLDCTVRFVEGKEAPDVINLQFIW